MARSFYGHSKRHRVIPLSSDEESDAGENDETDWTQVDMDQFFSRRRFTANKNIGSTPVKPQVKAGATTAKSTPRIRDETAHDPVPPGKGFTNKTTPKTPKSQSSSTSKTTPARGFLKDTGGTSKITPKNHLPRSSDPMNITPARGTSKTTPRSSDPMNITPARDFPEKTTPNSSDASHDPPVTEDAWDPRRRTSPNELGNSNLR